MSFSLRSVDVNEMWGPADTIERIQYKGKDLDFKFQFYCKEVVDYCRAYWFIDKLNEKKVKVKDLDKALKRLDISYKKVKEEVEREYFKRIRERG